MKKILMIILAVFLLIAAVGAIAVWVVPDEQTEETPSTDTGTGDTNNDLDADNGIGPQTPPIIQVENVEDLTAALASIEDGATIEIPSTLEISEPLNVGNKEVTFIFSEDYDKTVSVELEEGKVTIMNGHFNGIDIGGKGTLILENVMSLATTEGDSGLALLDGADITVQIKGSVSLTGAKDGDGIEVPYGTKLLLTGENLVAVGNNGLEYLAIDGYGNTDDETYLNKRGSGIGNAVQNIGSLTIKDMASLTAKGYGNKAFGIGGGDKSVVTIENTVIEYAKGGFAQSTFIASDLNYGKQEAEGGCAIGVGCGIDGDYDSGILKMKNVTVKQADGGSKSAAIGALYWTAVDITIQDCNFDKITGGTASAGIGGSRVYKNVSKDQYVKIFIDNSKINVTGGQYGAGIGSGYDCYCQTDYSVTYIEIIGENTVINAQGGINAAGIGTGHHSAGLAGYILPECEVNAKAGEMFIYEETYTQPQDIGYGMCNPNNEFANAALVFDIQGECVEAPVILPIVEDETDEPTTEEETIEEA
ncbi:MAG: hypothetical protein IJ039_05275 [Clostridia bacterium]|nr:hypothetical protein [Clostridia bacterium]